MADEQTAPNLAPQPTELELLKERARVMGITHSNNITAETLKAKIAAKLAGEADPEAPVVPAQANPFEASEQATIRQAMAVEKPDPEERLTLREHMIREHLKLIRLRITNLDSKKKDLPGEILTVANEHIGTIRKYIPYGEQTENGYHVPWCLYNMLKNRKFVSVTTKTDKATGQIHTTTRDVPEFSLEILEPLTRDELRELAIAQAAAGSVD